MAVTYFRAGYTPTDYPSEKEWKGREMIDLSKTISCPDCVTQLVGCKKVREGRERERKRGEEEGRRGKKKE